MHITIRAPVTSWDGYDTHYTERYMGTPDTNPVGYADSSVMSHVHRMKGSLMLVHGLIDENVHFRHTARLINELIRNRKKYDLVLFPCERHGPQDLRDKIYLEDRILEYFEDNMSKAQLHAQSLRHDDLLTHKIQKSEEASKIKITSNL